MVENKLDLRDKRIETLTRFVEERVGSIGLEWLLISVAVALGVGIVSLILSI